MGNPTNGTRIAETRNEQNFGEEVSKNGYFEKREGRGRIILR
jgi:hypothetical protein